MGWDWVTPSDAAAPVPPQWRRQRAGTSVGCRSGTRAGAPSSGTRNGQTSAGGVCATLVERTGGSRMRALETWPSPQETGRSY